MKQILILMIALLLIGTITAEECKVTVSFKDAYETTTVTKQIPVMEDKIVYYNKSVPVNVIYTASVPNSDKWRTDLANYNSLLQTYKTQLNVYSNLTNKSKAVKPIPPKYPVMTYTNVTRIRINYTIVQQSKTIQVQKTTTKTRYYINWTALKIETKTVSVPVYETKTETVSKLKSGYKLNEDTGEVYKYEVKSKC